LALRYQTERDAALTRAAAADRKATQARSDFAAVAGAAPDTCAPVIAAAETVFVALKSINSALSDALQSNDSTIAHLSAALDTTQHALSSLRSAATTLVVADARLANSTKAPWYSRLLPHPGVGVSAGIDPAGHFRVITGFSLGWTF